MKAFVILIIILLMLLFSCKRAEVNETHWFDPIDSKLESFYFKPGSYWIYKNDSTDNIDTVLLMEVTSGIDPVPFGQGNYHDYAFYDGYYFSNFQGSHYHDRIQQGGVYRNPCTGYPYGAWGVTLFTVDTVTIPNLSFIDSIQVEGHVYNNVQKFSVMANTGPGGSPCQYGWLLVNTDFYTVDSIGIIRKVVYSSPTETWDLIEYKIVR